MPQPSLARVDRKVVCCALMGLLTFLAVRWVVDRHSSSEPPTEIVAEAPAKILAVHAKESPYLGPQACAECHAARVSEFQSTRHFLANCVPEPGTMPFGFQKGKQAYRDPNRPIQFEMFDNGGQFFQSAIRQTESGEQKVLSEIAFIYGARGGNDEVYFTWHGDRLKELPIAWIAPLETWGASPYDRHGNGDFSRDTTIRCIECHNTWFDHVPRSRNHYGHDHNILGVTCEVCHGPGREHVDFHKKFPQEKMGQAVVHPGKLSRERLMDLCAQCHSNALKHRGPAFRYRPGEPLDDYYYSLKTKNPEDDHVANQTTYLKQSKCFQKSETLTCVTCHDPHRPRSATNAGAVACRHCHQPDDCSDRSRLPSTVRDDCVGCHMPERRKVQVFFQTEADRYVAPVRRYEHRIAIYSDARSEVLLNWYQSQSDSASRAKAEHLSKALGTFYRDETDALRKEFRFIAAIEACRNSLKFDPNTDTQKILNELLTTQSQIDADLQDGLWHESERRYTDAIDAFQRVLAAKPDHPTANGKIGTNYAVVGQRELAVDHLQRAADCDCNDPYPTAMLGWLAYLDGRPGEALGYYRKAEEVEPYTAKINHQMGLAQFKLENWAEAERLFTKAVSIDPNVASSLLALSQTLRRQGKSQPALETALQAVKVTHSKDAEILMNLAESYAELSQWHPAVEAAEKGLAALRPRQSRMIQQFQTRLQEFRSRTKVKP